MNFDKRQEVTDPNILAQLNGTAMPPQVMQQPQPQVIQQAIQANPQARQEVTDPNILAQLNGTAMPPQVMQQARQVQAQPQKEEDGFFTGLRNLLNPIDMDELKMDLSVIGEGEEEELRSARTKAVAKALFNTIFQTKNIRKIATGIGDMLSDDNDDLTNLENIVSKINNDTDLKLSTEAGLNRFQKMASTLGFSKLLRHKQTGQAWIYNPNTGAKYPIERVVQGQKDAGFFRSMFQNMANNPKTTFMTAMPVGGRSVGMGLGWGKNLANVSMNALEMGGVTALGKSLDTLTNSEKSTSNQIKDIALEGVAGAVGQGAFDGAGIVAGAVLQKWTPKFYEKMKKLNLLDKARENTKKWSVFLKDKVPVGGGKLNAFKGSWDNVSNDLKNMSMDELRAFSHTDARKDEAELLITLREAMPILGFKEIKEPNGNIAIGNDPNFKGPLRADEVSKIIQEINFKDLSLTNEYKKFISTDPQMRAQAQEEFRNMLSFLHIEMDKGVTAREIKESIGGVGHKAKQGLDDMEEELAKNTEGKNINIDYNILTNPNFKDYNTYARHGLDKDGGAYFETNEIGRRRLLENGADGEAIYQGWKRDNSLKGQISRAVGEFKSKQYEKNYLAKQIQEKQKMYNFLTKPKKEESIDELLNRHDLPKELQPYKEEIKIATQRLDDLNANVSKLEALKIAIIKSNSNAEYLKAFREVLGSQVKEETNAVEHFLKRSFGDIKGLTPKQAKSLAQDIDEKDIKTYLLNSINSKMQSLEADYKSRLIDPATGKEYKESQEIINPLVEKFKDFRAKSKPEDLTKTKWAKEKMKELRKLEKQHRKLSEETEGQTVASIKDYARQEGVKSTPLNIATDFRKLESEIKGLRETKRDIEKLPSSTTRKSQIKGLELRESYLLDQMRELVGEEGMEKYLKSKKDFAEWAEFKESVLGRYFDDEVTQENLANTKAMLNHLIGDSKQLSRDNKRALNDTMKFIKTLIDKGEKETAYKLERHIQDALIQKSLKLGEKDGKANYRELLDALNVLEMQTKEGKALLEERRKAFNSIQALADIIDTKFERLIKQLSQGISPNPLMRLHTMWGNYVIQNLKKYIPSEAIGQIPAIMYHSKEALRAKSGAKKGFDTVDGAITNIKELGPNVKDEARRLMDDLYKSDNKLSKLMAKSINVFVKRHGDKEISDFAKILSDMYKTMAIMRKTFNKVTLEQAKRDAFKDDDLLKGKKSANYLQEKYEEYKRGK